MSTSVASEREKPVSLARHPEEAPGRGTVQTSARALVCQGNDAHRGWRPSRGIVDPPFQSGAGPHGAPNRACQGRNHPVWHNANQAVASRTVACPAGYRHRRANRTDKLPPSSTTARIFLLISPNQLNCLKVFIMRQSQVALPGSSPVAVPTFTAAAIRFILSLGALIGLSLLLASL